MTYEEFFNKYKNEFDGTDVSNVNEHLAYQFNIVGEAEGIFYVEVKDGQLFIEPYDYNDRDALFIATADVFQEIADGKLDPVHAFTTGKLKVEGNIDKALKLQDLINSKNNKKTSAVKKAIVSKSASAISKKAAAKKAPAKKATTKKAD